ncbi:MAG: hypothetical protein GTO40_10670 [Deltaproteobacteria bacterium]|nr:hypothetical protein [Deltaproteobacteria bacterium]
MAIRLFQFPTSMFCEKARIVLTHKNLPYEIVNARDDERKGLIAFSGQKKVPVMDYDGQCIIDSTVICNFLEEKHPQQSIYPDNLRDKALCILLEDWSDEVLYHSVHMQRSKEPPEVRKEGVERMHRNLNDLEKLFGAKKGFIFDRITLADIGIFVELHYLYTSVKSEVPASYKNVHAWMDLMRQTLNLSDINDIAA